MVLILECHTRDNYQYRIFTTWQAIPFKRKFYSFHQFNYDKCHSTETDSVTMRDVRLYNSTDAVNVGEMMTELFIVVHR